MTPITALAPMQAVGKARQNLAFRTRVKEHPSDCARDLPNDFTRERKVGFVERMSTILHWVRPSTPCEIR